MSRASMSRGSMSDAGYDSTTPRSIASSRAKAPPAALQLKWCFGFNKDMRNGVINLSDGHNRRIFYCAGHTGILFDVHKHKQILLQGHSNAITCVCASADRRWIATADSGPDSMIVVWDVLTGDPIKTIFAPHENGVLAMDMSPDALMLTTLSNDLPQTISVWEWTKDQGGEDKPLVSATVATDDVQTCVLFNPKDNREIITNAVAYSDFKQRVGSFTVSSFIPNSTQALTATVDGDVVVWDSGNAEEGSQESDRHAIKLIHLHDQPITCLTTASSKYVVSGSTDGNVRFFDSKLRMVAWFEDIKSGAITSISFQKEDPIIAAKYAQEQGFRTPDFSVGTDKAEVVWMKSYMFEEVDAEYRKGELVLQGMEGSVRGLAPHPARHEIIVAGYSGALYVWDYEELKLVMLKLFDKLLANVVAYDPRGNLIAVGFTNGVVKLLNADTLEEIRSFKFSKDCITHITFASDSKCFATADADRCVGLYRFEKVTITDDNGDKRVEERWEFIGKYRSHLRPITSIQFGVGDDGLQRLVSIGEDRQLFEYDLIGSTITGGVCVKNKFPVAQSAIPTALMWQPKSRGKGSQEDIVIIANDQYKLKTYNANSNIIRKTVLGPTFAGPINKLYALPHFEEDYIVYSTNQKVIGLMKTPLDGNPNKSIGLIAHPNEIADLVLSPDGSLAMTSGGPDGIVSIWNINPQALDVIAAAGGEGIEPFYSLIDGGQDNEFFKEIEEYFYYAQLRSQGEASMEEFKISRSVNIDQVPDIMRALYYYPSEFDIQEMMNEMRYSKVVETGQYVNEIDFNDLIKIYVNHRPVEEIVKRDVGKAFEMLGAVEGSGLLDRETLLHELQRRGEAFTEQELMETLSGLLGDSSIRDLLPVRFTGDEFAEQVLGFEENAGPQVQDDAEQPGVAYE